MIIPVMEVTEFSANVFDVHETIEIVIFAYLHRERRGYFFRSSV